MVKGSEQATLLALAEQYQARADAIANGLEKTQKVLRALQRCIRSNWELELLLLLVGEPARAWSIAALTAELRSSRGAVREALGSLEAAGLVMQDAEGLYRYQPRTRELADLVHQLERACAAFPVSMIAAIFSRQE